jgi:phage repressor protein C with HTH and peptisase S24 domain
VVVFGYDHLVVKRIKKNALATEGRLRLLSDNPTGGELDLPADELQGIFRVLSVTRNL